MFQWFANIYEFPRDLRMKRSETVQLQFFWAVIIVIQMRRLTC